MAIEGVQTRWSFPAGANLTQYTFVKLTSTGTVIPCAATTDRPIGVVQDAPLSGDTATVCVIGITKLVTGAAATTGLPVATDIGTDASAAGLAIVPGTDTTKYLVATVIEASAAAAEYCSVWVNCPTAGRAA